MVGPSTLRALNTRALRTADWLHYRAKDLEEKLGRKISPGRQYIDSIESEDGTPVMVNLKASDLANLVLQMYQQEAELRRFAEPIKLRRR
jgi:hypothetical protein